MRIALIGPITVKVGDSATRWASISNNLKEQDMAPDTGRIYHGEEIEAAIQRGEHVVPVTREFALQFKSGSTEAQKAAQALDQLKRDKPYLSQVVLEQRAREAARGAI